VYELQEKAGVAFVHVSEFGGKTDALQRAAHDELRARGFNFVRRLIDIRDQKAEMVDDGPAVPSVRRPGQPYPRTRCAWVA
jgi:hypothetical protein